MSERFPLPEGMAWRDVEDRDLGWLGTFGFRDPVIGIITVRIRLVDPRTGEEREVYSDSCGNAIRKHELENRGPDRIIGGIVFHWTEGNFGCGCNRTIFWHEAGSEPVPEEHPCDAPYRISWPQWLADFDAEPYRGEPRPWKVDS